MPPVKTATSRQSTLAQHGRVNSDHQHTPSWSPAGGTAHAHAVGMVSRRRLESARLHSVSRRCAPRRPPIGTRLSPCGGPLKARRVRADCWSLLARLSAATEASRGVPGRLGTPAPRPPRDASGRLGNAVPGRHFAQVSLVLLFYLCFSLLAWSACCWSALGLSSLWSAPAPLPSTSSATTRMSRPRPHFPSVLLTPFHLSPLTFFFRLSHPTACLVRPLLLLRSPLSTPTTRLRPDSLTSPLSPAPQTSACSRIRIRPLDASPLGWQRPRRRPRPRRWQRPHRRPWPRRWQSPHRRPRPRRWRLPLRRPSP